jgi:hypothetical protein
MISPTSSHHLGDEEEELKQKDLEVSIQWHHGNESHGKEDRY